MSQRVPTHIGIIPDGNRRWAVTNGLAKEAGYEAGLAPGIKLFRLCHEAGIKEVTFYGFTQDNTKRPRVQTRAFQKACVQAVKLLTEEDAALLVMGNSDSPMFPQELLPYTKRSTFGSGKVKLNFLVNYGWQWDLSFDARSTAVEDRSTRVGHLRSADISRLDLIIRWGGRRRLSGFLPVQSVYADFYVLDHYWPDFQPEHFYDALKWYRQQDVTLGG